MFLGHQIINDFEKRNIPRCRILGCICRDVARGIPASAQNKFRPPHTRWLKIILKKIIFTKAYLYYKYMVRTKGLPTQADTSMYSMPFLLTNICCTRPSSQRLKSKNWNLGEYLIVNIIRFPSYSWHKLIELKQYQKVEMRYS